MNRISPQNNIRQNTNKLQARLMFVFTLLIVFCVATVTFFLYNVTRMISLNSLAQTTFEQTRQVYQLQTLLNNYRMVLKQYATSTSYLANEQIAALDKRMGQAISTLQTILPAEDQPSLQKLNKQREHMTSLSNELLEAVSEEDWDRVAALDENANQRLTEMDAEITAISARGLQRVEAVESESDNLSILGTIGGILAVPVFLAMGAIAILIIFFQINLPMELLAGAAQDVNEGKFKPESLKKLSQRDDEIGELAQEFFRMADSIRKRKYSLEQEALAIRGKFKNK